MSQLSQRERVVEMMAISGNGGGNGSDLNGSVVVRIEQYSYPGTVEVKTLPSVDVSIVGLADDPMTVMRHTCIYSGRPSCGKAYVFDADFLARYSSCSMRCLAGLKGASPSAQFLVFEGQAKEKKSHLPLEALEALIDGRRRGRGRARPIAVRSDVQMIMLSTDSIYDVYGEWDQKSQRRYMSLERIAWFEERFNIVKLDGDVRDDRMRCTRPAQWTDAQFYGKLRDVCDRAMTRIADMEITARTNMEMVVRAIKVSLCLWDSMHEDAWFNFCQCMVDLLETSGGDDDRDGDGSRRTVRWRRSTGVRYPCVAVSPAMFLEKLYRFDGRPLAGVARDKTYRALVALETVAMETIAATDAAPRPSTVSMHVAGTSTAAVDAVEPVVGPSTAAAADNTVIDIVDSDDSDGDGDGDAEPPSAKRPCLAQYMRVANR